MLVADTPSEFTGVGSVSISLALFWAFFLGANATAEVEAEAAVPEVVEVVTPLVAAAVLEVGGIETNLPSYLIIIPLPSAALVGAVWAVTALVAL